MEFRIDLKDRLSDEPIHSYDVETIKEAQKVVKALRYFGNPFWKIDLMKKEGEQWVFVESVPVR